MSASAMCGRDSVELSGAAPSLIPRGMSAGLDENALMTMLSQTEVKQFFDSIRNVKYRAPTDDSLCGRFKNLRSGATAPD